MQGIFQGIPPFLGGFANPTEMPQDLAIQEEFRQCPLQHGISLPVHALADLRHGTR